MKAAWSILAAFLVVAATGASAEVVIKGSNTFGEELGPALVEGFRKQHPDIAVTLDVSNSGIGIAALLAGECNVAASSRSLNDDELRLAKSMGIKLKSESVAYYGVGVVVHADNPVKNLATRQVREIFTGRLANWKSLGGADLPIRVLVREKTAGTYLGFRELAMNNEPYRADATELSSYHAIQEAVAADPSAIGFTAIPLARTAGTRLLKINGIAPNMGSVAFDNYPYIRLVRLFTGPGRRSDDVLAFLRFVASSEGQRIAEAAGFVPHQTPPPRIDMGP